MPFSLNPDIASGLATMLGGQPLPPKPPAGDVITRRQNVEGMWGGLMAGFPDINDVETQDFHVKASDGHEILLRWFAKKGSSPGSAILYIHGGGMISLSVDHFDKIIQTHVSNSGVPFLAVDYRLAPEVRYPVPVEDCYAGLQYLHSHASDLGVDTKRIGIMGDSAGGGLAAALAHLAKEKQGPAIQKQILIYPMLDDRNTIADPEIAPYAMWAADDNKTGWGALLDGKDGTDSIPPTAAPARMTVDQASGLPATYIDVGQLDIFADENMEYARKLSKAGVDCEFHLIPSVPHAFEGIAAQSDAAKNAAAWRMAAIKGI
ncbi:alpha/beta hydrolase domain-containing protein [Acrodontium crateriforme]|uniref:Alpha/beta hydrolase domain-containing protein n=1 Tax=Acrodontium crateriforme TaxID=150365 RepID=A0AAQ3M5H4_9PEZI|nr:alpha/beta hydrolase domain-containing protein [Acrodontium crateriforme]